MGRWTDYSNNVGSAAAKEIIILRDGTAQLQNNSGDILTADAIVDNGIIVFNQKNSAYSVSYEIPARHLKFHEKE